MSFSEAPKLFLRTLLVMLTVVTAVFVSASETRAAAVIVENKGLLGIIKGSVRDEAGNPIADAYVSFFKVARTTRHCSA